MKRLLSCPFFFLFLFPSLSLAWDVRKETEQSRSQISFVGESSLLSTEAGNVQGAGAQVEFGHFFRDDISMNIAVATALASNNGLSSSFTGFYGYANYLISGTCCLSRTSTLVDGNVISSEVTNRTSRWLAGIGLEQFFLNGNRGVYSASGPGVGTSYYFQFWDYTWKAEFRYATLLSNQKPVGALFLGLGLSFDL